MQAKEEPSLFNEGIVTDLSIEVVINRKHFLVN